MDNDDFKKFLDRLKSGEAENIGNPFTDEETPILEPPKNDEDIKQMLKNMNNRDADFLSNIMEPIYRESDKKLAENRKHLLRQLKMDRGIFLMEMIREHGVTPEYDDSYKETIEISLKISRLIEYLMTEELREGGA